MAKISFNIFNTTHGSKGDNAKEEAQNIKNDAEDTFEHVKADLTNEYNELLDALEEEIDAIMAAELKKVTSKLLEAQNGVKEMQNQLQSFDTWKKGEIQKLANGSWATGNIRKSNNWCMSWGNGIDYRNSGWRDYGTGMKDCQIESKSGWVKMILEGRTCGNNHGG